MKSKETQDVREDYVSTDKALISNDGNSAREPSLNSAHTTEFKEVFSSRRGGQNSITTSLLRKPLRQADAPQELPSGELSKPADKSLPDSKAFELGNSRLVIKSKPAKATPNDSGSSNVKKTKLIPEIVRKAVIDILAHTDNMEEALHRALVSFGNRSTYWDQVSCCGNCM